MAQIVSERLRLCNLEPVIEVTKLYVLMKRTYVEPMPSPLETRRAQEDSPRDYASLYPAPTLAEQLQRLWSLSKI